MLDCLSLFFTQPALTIFSKFPDFLPISGSIIDIMADLYLGVKFCSSQILHFLSCFCVYFTLHFFFSAQSSTFLSLTFLKHYFICTHVNLNSFSSIFPSKFTSSLSIFTFLTFVLHCQYYFIFNWVTLFSCFLFPSFLDPPIIWHKHITPHT